MFLIQFMLCFPMQLCIPVVDKPRTKHETIEACLQLAYYKSLGTPMSEAQFMQNAENAYQNKATEFNNKQASFIQDILTCYQLINIIENLEKGVPVASQP